MHATAVKMLKSEMQRELWHTSPQRSPVWPAHRTVPPRHLVFRPVEGGGRWREGEKQTFDEHSV